ncbi:MAG: NADH-quinone oxidoreductase subunit J [Candidatus Promineifilaceae bacterium]
MTPQQIIFLIIATVTLTAALIVVTDRNLFHAALAMMASFFGVAGMYVLLEAGFLAAAQLLVYIGAISILIIFAIMMTRRLMQSVESPFNSQSVSGLVAAVISFVGLFLAIVVAWPDSDFPAPPDVGADVLRGTISQLGVVLVSPNAYVVPFEVASVLLLAALVGSIFIAFQEKKES